MVTVGEVSVALEHPFVLLVIGALISGVLVAWLTNRWENRRKKEEIEVENRRKEREIEVEDHRKELEIKADVISKMTEVMGHQFANAFNALDHRKSMFTDAEEATYYEDLKKSITDSMVISSKLIIYFPETSLANNWSFYSAALISFGRASQGYFYKAPSK